MNELLFSLNMETQKHIEIGKRLSGILTAIFLFSLGSLKNFLNFSTLSQCFHKNTKDRLCQLLKGLKLLGHKYFFI